MDSFGRAMADFLEGDEQEQVRATIEQMQRDATNGGYQLNDWILSEVPQWVKDGRLY